MLPLLCSDLAAFPINHFKLEQERLALARQQTVIWTAWPEPEVKQITPQVAKNDKR